MNKAEVMAIIPARGGSKAIHKKNIAHLGGKPLISYAIEAARASGCVNRIVVTTDSEEIASVCISLGVDVPFLRPAQLAGDNSNVMDALYHAVEWLENNEGYKAEIMSMIQPTSPFIRADQISQCVHLLQSNPNAHAVTTVIEVPHVFHPYNVRVIKQDGSVDFMMPKEHYLNPNRQAKPKFYAFGNLYVYRYRTLVEGRSLYGELCLPVVIDPLSAYDINDPLDLEIAEVLLSHRRK